MLVLVGTPNDGQAVLLVLDVAPEQVIERAQRIELELSEERTFARSTAILETQADRRENLHEHRLLVPVRPDELDQRRAAGALVEDVGAEARLKVVVALALVTLAALERPALLVAVAVAIAPVVVVVAPVSVLL